MKLRPYERFVGGTQRAHAWTDVATTRHLHGKIERATRGVSYREKNKATPTKTNPTLLLKSCSVLRRLLRAGLRWGTVAHEL